LSIHFCISATFQKRCPAKECCIAWNKW